MKITVLMISTLLVIKIQAECPLSCKCTTTSVSCISQNLETIPSLYSLKTSPIILDFSGNKLVFIDVVYFDFPKSSEVKEVYLNNSAISDIAEGTFDNLENLQEVYLSGNLLGSDSLPESFIEKLDNMLLLDLSNNYFNGDMPTVRSPTLEVFNLVNSKISSIPKNALKYLPKLKFLVLQQNNIQVLSFEPFKNYAPSSFFVGLTLNPWKCTCETLKAFLHLSNRKFVETLEPYRCVHSENKSLNIFNPNGGVTDEECDYDETELQADQELQEYMINDEKVHENNEYNDIEVKFLNVSYKYDYDEQKELDIKHMNDNDLRAALTENCWQVFTDSCSNYGIFAAIVISTLIIFFIGFVTGLVCCKIVYCLRYRRLEQASDSQVTLLRA